MIGPGDLDEYFEWLDRELEKDQQKTSVLKLHAEIMEDLSELINKIAKLQLKIIGLRQ